MGYMSGPFPFRTWMWIGGWQPSGLMYKINEWEVEGGKERKVKKQFDHFRNKLETLRYLSVLMDENLEILGDHLKVDLTLSSDDRAWGS